MSDNKNQISLDIPAQLERIQSMREENCDNIETIILHEQTEPVRPKSEATFSMFQNNWI